MTPKDKVRKALQEHPQWKGLPWALTRFHLWSHIGTLSYREIDEATEQIRQEERGGRP
jgi:hypothetical protein